MNKLIILFFFLIFLLNAYAQATFEVFQVEVTNASVGSNAVIRIACSDSNIVVAVSIKESECTVCSDKFRYNIQCDTQFIMPESDIFNTSGLHELIVNYNGANIKKAYFNVMPAKSYAESSSVPEMPAIFVLIVLAAVMLITTKRNLTCFASRKN